MRIDLSTYFTNNILIQIEKYIPQDETFLLEEIRLRTARPIILKLNFEEIIIPYKATYEDILNTLQTICENSIYSYQNQICNGYITVHRGHRVGLVGSVVLEENKIMNINYISGLNFRIAREVIGCSDELLQNILDIKNNSIFNTIIVSPPGERKNNYVKRCNKAN